MNEDSINLNSEKLKNIPLSNLRAKNLLTLRKEKINNSHLMKRLHSTIPAQFPYELSPVSL